MDMEIRVLKELLERGEDSFTQFKKNIANADSLADEMVINNLTINDFDMEYFENYFRKRFGESLDEQKQTAANVLTNMNLLKDNCLTLCAAELVPA